MTLPLSKVKIAALIGALITILTIIQTVLV
jgi:hypothetical protein